MVKHISIDKKATLKRAAATFCFYNWRPHALNLLGLLFVEQKNEGLQSVKTSITEVLRHNICQMGIEVRN